MLLYALTILVSAFLLFQVEPVIAKIILPWFGGSAAVWTTCLLFFQMVLLLGYLYAHAVFRYLKPKVQTAAHAVLLLASLAALPVLPGDSWKPNGAEDPTFRILGLLAVTIGLPYFLLSTTGPLLQAWYSRRFKGAMPYRLYALSNAGSMFALLSYPVLFEPRLTTHQQAIWWSFGYGLFVVVCGFTALRSGNGAAVETVEDTGPLAKPTGQLYALWVGLPACASVMLLAFSTHLSQNVASIPFLWILPLSIYLLTFILCFESDGWYRRNPYLQFMAVSLGGMAYSLRGDFETESVKVLVPLFSCGLFICCMVCHGELARLKPHPRYLTTFYLMISAGGALGGLLVGLLAPRVFRGYYELPLSLVACAVLAIWALRADKELDWFRRWTQPVPIVSVVLTVVMAGGMGYEFRGRALNARVMVRNFYGGLKVRDSGTSSSPDGVRTLTHGTINHGEQFLNPARRRSPITYYGPKTGIGLAIRAQQSDGPLRVGVIGLGTGTLAAYGRPGDYYRFYEINPLVIDLAQTEFTYIKDTGAKVDIALGDARLSLEREQPENYDVLAVDAFSSDSIPVHLLTVEAFRVYFRHLKPGGVLAVHVSNKYLDLKPVVQHAAEALGKRTRVVDTEDEEDEEQVFGATWVLLTGTPEIFQRPLLATATPLQGSGRVRLWTDQYSNLFQILR
jgi:SAM-dependent methyltransferase